MNSICKKFTSNKRKTKYLFALMSDINLTESHQNLKLAEKHLKEAREKMQEFYLTETLLIFLRKIKIFMQKEILKANFKKISVLILHMNF